MRQFFPGVHIGILRSMKSCFELFQLFTSERSSTSTLLPLQSYPRFTLCIRIVTATSTWKTVYITNIILHILKPYVRKNPISRIKQFHKAFYLKLLKSFSNRTHNIREYFKGLTHRGGGKKNFSNERTRQMYINFTSFATTINKSFPRYYSAAPVQAKLIIETGCAFPSPARVRKGGIGNSTEQTSVYRRTYLLSTRGIDK